MAVASLSPLRHRGFALAFTSSFVSSIGTWMQSVALGIYLTEATRNPLWLGLLVVCAWSPAVVGAPLGGVVADRLSRQHWIQLNNLCMAATASTLAVAALTHHLSPALACYLAVGEGLCSSASQSAWQSLLPDLVERDEVLAAVSLSSATFNLGRVIGPVCAALAMAAGSVGLCFALNAASFVFVLVVFAFVRSAPRAKPSAGVRVLAELAAGARRAWSLEGCRNPIIGIGVVGVVVSPFIALVPAMAIITLHAGKGGTTWLITAQGVGAVLGALVLPVLAQRTSRRAVLRGSASVAVVALAAYGVAPSIGAAVSSMVLLGGAYMGIMTGLATSVQLHAPVAERARILALYNLSLSIFYPLGALVQASLARIYGVRAVTLVDAGVLAGTLLALSVAAGRYWRAFGPAEQPEVLLAD